MITTTAIMISKLTTKSVVVSSLGVGGSYIRDWSEGGIAPKYEIALQHMKNDKLDVGFFFLHQGESDSARDYKTVNGTDSSVYYKRLSEVIMKSKQFFPESSFGVALATICLNSAEFNPVRNAQYSITKNMPNVFISADSDKIVGAENRYDNCHFSGKGAFRLGNVYFKSIEEKLFINLTNIARSVG